MNKPEDIVSTFVEIELPKEESFLLVKETLTRMGVGVGKTKTLYPSCLILHKRGKYYLVHFKEMFLLDQKSADFSENDRARRNTIAYLLQEWGLIRIVNESMIQEPRVPVSQIKIVPFKEKNQWTIQNKYTVGQG